MYRDVRLSNAFLKAKFFALTNNTDEFDNFHPILWQIL